MSCQNVNPINNFKINTYFFVIDKVNSQILEKFEISFSPFMNNLTHKRKKNVS